LAGAAALLGFALAHLGLAGATVERAFYWIAIPLGAFHWAREGIENLVREREVGIEILMLAAAAGYGFLGLWDEAAALVVLYGAAEHAFHRARQAIIETLHGRQPAHHGTRGPSSGHRRRPRRAQARREVAAVRELAAGSMRTPRSSADLNPGVGVSCCHVTRKRVPFHATSTSFFLPRPPATRKDVASIGTPAPMRRA
jgi:hypothetical protein